MTAVENCRQLQTRVGLRGGWRELNPHPLVHSQVCRNRYTTTTISTPTRIRTWNCSFEARDDVPFTIGVRAEGKGVEPSSPCGELPFQSSPANRIRLPSFAVDSPGVEPGSPARQAGIFPLDDEPSRQWTAGESNPDFRCARPASSHWTSSPVSDPGWSRTITAWV